MIMNRGTSTATLIRRLPKVSVGSASSVRPVKVDSLDRQVKVNRVRLDRHVTRIKLAQRDRPVSPACHKFRRCLWVNLAQSQHRISKTAARRMLMRKHPDPLARRARHVSLALHVHRASRAQNTPPANAPHKSPTGWIQIVASHLKPHQHQAQTAEPS